MIPNLDLTERLLGEVCTTVQLYCQNLCNFFATQYEAGLDRIFWNSISLKWRWENLKVNTISKPNANDQATVGPSAWEQINYCNSRL